MSALCHNRSSAIDPYTLCILATFPRGKCRSFEHLVGSGHWAASDRACPNQRAIGKQPANTHSTAAGITDAVQLVKEIRGDSRCDHGEQADLDEIWLEPECRLSAFAQHEIESITVDWGSIESRNAPQN